MQLLVKPDQATLQKLGTELTSAFEEMQKALKGTLGDDLPQHCSLGLGMSLPV